MHLIIILETQLLSKIIFDHRLVSITTPHLEKGSVKWNQSRKEQVILENILMQMGKEWFFTITKEKMKWSIKWLLAGILFSPIHTCHLITDSSPKPIWRVIAFWNTRKSHILIYSCWNINGGQWLQCKTVMH